MERLRYERVQFSYSENTLGQSGLASGGRGVGPNALVLAGQAPDFPILGLPAKCITQSIFAFSAVLRSRRCPSLRSLRDARAILRMGEDLASLTRRAAKRTCPMESWTCSVTKGWPSD